MSPFRLSLGLLVLAGALYAPAALAQPATAPVPIAAVLEDADGDLVPDAVGDTVTIAGRATFGSGQLHRNWTELFVQDATGGIRLMASSAEARVTAGALRRQVGKRVAELHDSEVRYAHLFNAAGDAVVLHADDVNGWLMDVNDEATRAFGFPRHAMYRQSLRLLAVPEAGAAVERHLATARLTEEARDTFFLRTGDAERAVPFEIRTHRLHLEG